MAFYLASQAKLNVNEAFKFANPLLLATGPIALFVKRAGQKTLKKRINYYLPFILIGVFFFQIVASPLTNFFFLIEKIDLVSVLLFATIFEIFVYANFCGLSLIIYGIFGIFGYRIPLNFKQPFSSSNVVDFWRGWHTSLSAVLKVLFYTPLRKKTTQFGKKTTQFVALSGVFIASALWHGATLNFLIWGSFHAIVFWISLVLLRSNIKVLPMIVLIFGVIIGRLIFADSDTDRLLEKLMFSYDGIGAFSALLSVPNSSKAALALGATLILIEFFFQKNRYVRKRNYKHLRSPRVLVLFIVIGVFLITTTGGDYAVYGQR
jgi:D-alanyl-lipoteichoic acid acyltransferase DltB (MBOAT superfamily)